MIKTEKIMKFVIDFDLLQKVKAVFYFSSKMNA